MNFSYIPKEYEIPSNAAYLHITTNNTIFGTQFHDFPESPIPLIGDMSSDIFSREFDINKFGIIYGGAQKNMGPAGITLVVVRKDLLGKVSREIPTMLNYKTHIAKKSSFNTPAVFPIYTSLLNLRWLKDNGGVAGASRRNEQKAALLYQEIDDNPFFEGTAAKVDRSRMNATFVLTDPDLESRFLQDCEEAGIVGIKGHRSVGGFRASMYNAMKVDSVRVLVETMHAFASQYA
jgi:phosphoserine aminotransferase